MQIIQASELKTRMDQDEAVCLLDVREPHEHAEFNIGGTLLPLGNILSMQIEDIEEWRQQEVICYCRSGQRSMQAAMMLESMGFTNVKNLAGGMLGWKTEFGC
jgi:rhodanese-related sulfurtransferase